MKQFLAVLAVVAAAAMSASADVKVVSIKGDVTIRHGAQEEWLAVAPGDVIKPEDSMRSGKRSSVVLLVDDETKLTLPEMVIVDCSDLRTLTQEELLLKLAMEGIRAVPGQKRDGGMSVPRTTTVHGTKSESARTARPESKEGYVLLLNGTKVLHRHGFYATMILRAKEIFRLAPEMSKRTDVRLMIADSFEKLDLGGDALVEYRKLSKEKLSLEERSVVESKIAELKKKQRG